MFVLYPILKCFSPGLILQPTKLYSMFTLPHSFSASPPSSHFRFHQPSLESFLHIHLQPSSLISFIVLLLQNPTVVKSNSACSACSACPVQLKVVGIKTILQIGSPWKIIVNLSWVLQDHYVSRPFYTRHIFHTFSSNLQYLLSHLQAWLMLLCASLRKQKHPNESVHKLIRT